MTTADRHTDVDPDSTERGHDGWSDPADQHGSTAYGAEHGSTHEGAGSDTGHDDDTVAHHDSTSDSTADSTTDSADDTTTDHDGGTGDGGYAARHSADGTDTTTDDTTSTADTTADTTTDTTADTTAHSTADSTTADATVAGGSAATASTGAGTSGTGSESLFPAQRAKEYSDRWDVVKGDFVDEPRQAVAAADQLVGELLDELDQLFRRQRSELEGGLDAEETSTEDLRQALRRYRSFFDRLLTI